MEVFHCDSPHSLSDNSKSGEEKEGSSESRLEEFPLWAGPCGSDDAPAKLGQCKKVLAAWAIGAGPFVYPKVFMGDDVINNISLVNEQRLFAWTNVQKLLYVQNY